MLIEVKVKTVRRINNKLKRKLETYLIDKEFFSQAEFAVTSELTEEQTSNLLESFEIQSLRLSPVREIVQTDGENTFIATLKDIFLEEDGTEKNLRYKVLLYANNLTEANQRTNELARQGYSMSIEGIKEVDYIYLENGEETGES